VLTARILHKVFYVLDYQEHSRSLLRYFWIGLSRTPLTAENNLHWTEHLDVAPLLHPIVRMLFDLAGPFFHFPDTIVDYTLNVFRGRVGNEEAIACVSSEIHVPRMLAFAAIDAPQRIELFIGPHHGILGGSVHLPHGRMTIERLDDVPALSTVTISESVVRRKI